MPQHDIGGLLGDETDPAAQEIAALRMQIETLQGGGQGRGMQPYGGQGSGGLLGGTFSKSQLDPSQIQGVYGLLAQLGDDPAEVGNQYVKAMQNQASIRGAYGQAPSSVREWEYYNSLSDEDKKAYLEMKRGVDLQNIAGSLQGIYSSGLRDPTPVGGGGDVYSTLGQEAGAAEVMAAGGARGGQLATRYGVLETGRTGRYENYSQATRLRNLVEQDKLKTGQYTSLIYKVIPQADQESLDSLALQVARTKLRIEFGETRMTDADVDNMMKALFGTGRTEEFTVESLDRLLREIQNQEDEYTRLSQYFSGFTGTQQGEAGYVPGAQVGGGGAQLPGGGGRTELPQGTTQPDPYAEASAEDLLAEQQRRRALGPGQQ